MSVSTGCCVTAKYTLTRPGGDNSRLQLDDQVAGRTSKRTDRSRPCRYGLDHGASDLNTQRGIFGMTSAAKRSTVSRRLSRVSCSSSGEL
jgi:hypothetical protein